MNPLCSHSWDAPYTLGSLGNTWTPYCDGQKLWSLRRMSSHWLMLLRSAYCLPVWEMGCVRTFLHIQPEVLPLSSGLLPMHSWQGHEWGQNHLCLYLHQLRPWPAVQLQQKRWARTTHANTGHCLGCCTTVVIMLSIYAHGNEHKYYCHVTLYTCCVCIW